MKSNPQGAANPPQPPQTTHTKEDTMAIKPEIMEAAKKTFDDPEIDGLLVIATKGEYVRAASQATTDQITDMIIDLMDSLPDDAVDEIFDGLASYAQARMEAKTETKTEE